MAGTMKSRTRGKTAVCTEAVGLPGEAKCREELEKFHQEDDMCPKPCRINTSFAGGRKFETERTAWSQVGEIKAPRH